MLDLNKPLTDLMCEVLHRNTESCTVATGLFFKMAYLRALPVYLPVYALPMLIFRHRALLKHPASVLLSTALNVARSSLFLSSYCTVCWAVACFATNLGMQSGVKGAIAGFCGGLTVALEKKGRRVELALYVLSQALPSGWRTLHQRGIVPMLPHGESLCFVGSMAVILWAYVTRPHLMRSSYLSLFLFFFGSGGRAAGFSRRAVEHSTTPKRQQQQQPHAIEDPQGQNEQQNVGTANHRLAVASPVALLAASSWSAATQPQQHQSTVAASAQPLSLSSSFGGSSTSAAASALSSPGALVMLARHSSRLSTVSDEPDESAGDGSDSNTNSTATPTPSPPTTDVSAAPVQNKQTRA